VKTVKSKGRAGELPGESKIPNPNLEIISISERFNEAPASPKPKARKAKIFFTSSANA
jgi:hypothetical protein